LYWILSAAPACGQQLPLRYYGQAEGLKNLSVNALAQDRFGYLWAGTENGLFRFDGDRFLQVEIDDAADGAAQVNALLSDKNGRIWAGTDSGLYVRENGRFTEVRLDPRHALSTINTDKNLSFLPDGTLLVISNGKLYDVRARHGGWTASALFSDDRIRAIPDLAFAHSVLATIDGTIWLATRKSNRNALFRIRRDEVENFGAQAGLPDDYWSGLIEGPRGELWVRSINKLTRLPPVQQLDAATRPAQQRHLVHAAQRRRQHADRYGRRHRALRSGAQAFPADRRRQQGIERTMGCAR
jgi:ligand-binding sensor domain-containing protein